MDTIKRINGNHQEYVSELPLLMILDKEWNDVALNHLYENTGLRFIKKHWNYQAQPTESKQIAALFMTYNFKTRYYDNWTHKNTLMLKSDHHTGFDVDAICFECVKYNNINTKGLKGGDFLAC